MKDHPDVFKPNTYYWVESSTGSFHPLLLNVDMQWKIDNHYIPHKAFIEMMKDSRIVEAIPPSRDRP